MGAMGCAKSVVHPHIAQLGEIFGRTRDVLFLFGVKAQVIEQNDIARFHMPRPPLYFGPMQSSSFLTGLPSNSAKRVATGFRRNLSSTPLGRPKCEHSTTRRAVIEQVLDRGIEARIRYRR
jgi:hypothetical protein